MGTPKAKRQLAATHTIISFQGMLHVNKKQPRESETTGQKSTNGGGEAGGSTLNIGKAKYRLKSQRQRRQFAVDESSGLVRTTSLSTFS